MDMLVIMVTLRGHDEASTVPERASILLFLLNNVKQVVTELKLQKLIFLIQNEAKVPKGYYYFKHYYGPYSKELNIDTTTLMNEGLLEKREVNGTNHPYWIFKITDRGRGHFKETFLDDRNSKLLDRMQNVVTKYAACNPYELTEMVYKKWDIRSPETVDSKIKYLRKDIQAIMRFWESLYFPECPTITYFLVFLEYSQEALGKVSEIDDVVIKSVLLGACRELNDNLANIAQVCSKKGMCPIEAERGLCQVLNPSISELFSFIEDFCQRNKVLPKLEERDLTELVTEEEYRCLQEAFKTIGTLSSL